MMLPVCSGAGVDGARVTAVAKDLGVGRSMLYCALDPTTVALGRSATQDAHS